MFDQIKNIKWRFIPIFLLFLCIPLIMRLVYLNVDPIYYDCLLTNVYPDSFFFYKGLNFIFLTIIMLISLVILRKQLPLHRDIFFRTYSICGLTFMISTVCSTYFSPYTDFAIIGGPTRFEGLGIILCYIMVMFYCYAVFKTTKDYKYILLPFMILIFIQTFVGFTQFIGYDFNQWKGIRELIAPGEFESLNFYASGSEPWFPKTSTRWTGTLGNSNYSGSFVALAVPFFLAITLSTPNFKKRLPYWFVTFCGIFIAFACRSRAGLIGIIISLVVGATCLIRFYPDNRKNINWREIVSAILITLTLMWVTNADTRFTSLFKDISKLFVPNTAQIVQSTQIESIDFDINKIIFFTNNGTLTVSYIDSLLTFEDPKLSAIDSTLTDDNIYIINSAPYTGYAFEKLSDPENIYIRFYKGYDVVNGQGGTPKCGFKINERGEITLANYWNFESAIIDFPPAIGFEGKERLGSGRGYIWSRSLPMLTDTLLLGYGPDMYMLKFPQHDFWGKWNGLSNPFQGVDKPHNTYIQIWINQGFPAFLSFMILCGTYLIHCFKLYGFKKHYTSNEGLGLAFMLASIGYLGASFFNDTTLSITPLFWALLGSGMAYNVIYKKNLDSIPSKP